MPRPCSARTNATTTISLTDRCISGRPQVPLPHAPVPEPGRSDEIDSAASYTSTCRSHEVTGFSAPTGSTGWHAKETLAAPSAIAPTALGHAGVANRVTVVVGSLGDDGRTADTLEREHGFGAGTLNFALSVGAENPITSCDGHSRVRERRAQQWLTGVERGSGRVAALIWSGGGAGGGFEQHPRRQLYRQVGFGRPGTGVRARWRQSGANTGPPSAASPVSVRPCQVASALVSTSGAASAASSGRRTAVSAR